MKQYDLVLVQKTNSPGDDKVLCYVIAPPLSQGLDAAHFIGGNLNDGARWTYPVAAVVGTISTT